MQFFRRVEAPRVPLGQNIRVYLTLPSVPAARDTHEFCVYVCELHRACAAALSVPNLDATQPWLGSGNGLRALRRARAGLGKVLEQRLTAASYDELVSLWSTHALLTVLLIRVVPTGYVLTETARRRLNADALDVTPGGAADVPRFTVTEWVDAIAVFRQRLRVLRHPHRTHLLYLDHLEARAGELSAGMADPAAYDEPLFVTSGVELNHGWYTSAAVQLTLSRYWLITALALPTTAPCVPPGARAQCQQQLLEFAARQTTLEHQMAFQKAVIEHSVPLGDPIAHARLHGLGVSVVSAAEVFRRSYPPTAATYCDQTRFRRPLDAWLRDAEEPVFGGTACEAHLQQLAHLFALKHPLDRYGIDFLRTFVVTQQRAGFAYERHIERKLLREEPFIVQALGFFVVYCTPAVAYKVETALDAIVVWAQAALEQNVRADVDLGSFLRGLMG